MDKTDVFGIVILILLVMGMSFCMGAISAESELKEKAIANKAACYQHVPEKSAGKFDWLCDGKEDVGLN